MFHIYIYAANRVWDTDRISRLRRPLLKRRAITHLGRKHARLGSGWVVGKQEVIRFLPGCPSFARKIAASRIRFSICRRGILGMPVTSDFVSPITPNSSERRM